MKVLVVSPSRVYGGGEVFVETIDLALRSINTHFIVSNERLKKNISAKRHVVSIYKSGRAISILYLIIIIWKMFIKHRYDVILLNGLPELGVFSRYLPRTRLVCVGHSEEAWCRNKVSFKKPLHALKRTIGYNFEKYLISFICITDVTRANVCSRYCLEAKCVNIYPTIKPFQANPSIKKGNSKMPLVFGRIGRLTAGKGNEELILAFRQARRLGLNIKLIFAGEGEDLSKLKRLVREMDLEEVVEFAGFMSREQFFTRVDICVSPSHHEGFPIILLEAMYSKTCIISSKVGGVPEMLNEQCAILYKAGDTDKLLEAIETVAKSSEVRKRLSDCAFCRFEENFSPDKFKIKLMEALNVR